MYKKQYAIRTDARGVVVVREEIARRRQKEGISYCLSFGLDASFRLVDPVQTQQGFFVNSLNTLRDGEDIVKHLAKLKEGKTGVYYRLSDITYICDYKITLKKGIKDYKLSLYCPEAVKDIKTISCSVVTHTFKRALIHTLKASLKNYVEARLSLKEATQ